MIIEYLYTMVLESIINPKHIENRKLWIFFLGIVYVLVGAAVAALIFTPQASLIVVFFASIVAIPLMYNSIKNEELKDLEDDVQESELLKEHFHVLEGYMSLFAGYCIGFSLLYIFISEGSLQDFFSMQHDILLSIAGHATELSTGDVVSGFTTIFFNNLQVLSLAIIFSFVFGAGAIFILTWNASVIGAAIGNFIRGNIEALELSMGLSGLCAQFIVYNFGFLRYVIHGVPEILAYFVGALAGGIIAIAVIRHDFLSSKFEKVVLDSADLILIAIGLLFIAALLEVVVTPYVFRVEYVDTLVNMCLI